MMDAPKPRNSYIACLTNRDFLYFYIGQYISFIGDRLAQLAFIAVLMGTIDAGAAVTGADENVTKLMLISLTPYLFMFPISGFLIDRFRRRNVMIVCTCLQGVVAIASAEMIRAHGFHDVANFVIYGSVLLIYTNSAVFNPAKYALIPQLIEPKHLLAANALNTSTATISTLIGTFLGVGIISGLHKLTGSETSGIVWSLYIDSLTFFIPGLLLFFITRDKENAPGKDIAAPSPWAQLVEGFHYIWTHRVVMRQMGVVLTIWFIAGLFNGGLNTLLLGGEDSVGLATYGLAVGTIGVGMFAGAILTGLTCRNVRPKRVLSTALLTTGILLATTRYTLAMPGVRLVALFITAAAAGGVIVTLDTLYQRIIPNVVRGRVFTINFLASTSALIVGMAVQLKMKEINIGETLSGISGVLFSPQSIYFQLASLAAFIGYAAIKLYSKAPITGKSG